MFKTVNKFKVMGVVAASAISLNLAAQSINVQNAYNEMKHGNYVDAKKYIDLAANNLETKEDKKMLNYRGMIYMAIAKDSALNLANPGASEVALNSYLKLKELDTKFKFVSDWQRGLLELTSYYSSNGIKTYMKANTQTGDERKASFNKAADNYSNAIISIGKPDKSGENYPNECTNIANFYGNAADMYRLGENGPRAIESYSNFIAFSSEHKMDTMITPRVFIDYASVYSNIQRDTTIALTILDQGIAKFPKSAELLKTKINIYLSSGKKAEALAIVNKAIELDPKNANLYEVLGSLYNDMKEPDKAVASFKKALEIDPKSGPANYNFALFLYNQGKKLTEEANKIPLNQKAKYEELLSKSKVSFTEALPFFEAAYKANPKDSVYKKGMREVLNALADPRAAEYK